MLLMHICEACDAQAVMTPDEGFDLGWDYPPRTGPFGILAPRLCPKCDITESLWWAIVMDRVAPDDLSAHHLATLQRVNGEPATILIRDDEEGADDE